MSDLLGLSVDNVVSPSIAFARADPRSKGQKQDKAFGWGIGWYPGEELGAHVIKDHTSVGDDPMTAVLNDWDHFHSTLFVCHLRGAAKRVTQRDTHPFTRSYARRSWLFAHNGQLEGDLAVALPLGEKPAFEPVGRTDSEHAFCWLLGIMQARGARTLQDLGWAELHQLLGRLNELGTANLLLSDGRDLVFYRDREGYNGLCWLRKAPPAGFGQLGNDRYSITLSGSLDHHRTAIVVSSQPLSGEDWIDVATGQMLVARRGSIIWDSLGVWGQQGGLPRGGRSAWDTAPPAPEGPLQYPHSSTGATEGESGRQLTPVSSQRSPIAIARKLPIEPVHPGTSKTHTVFHETRYSYLGEVAHSSHVFRMTPLHDPHQALEQYELKVSVEGEWRSYEDVFGNYAIDYLVTKPYNELIIRAVSSVRVHAPVALDELQTTARETLPLVWMPWQRQMMLPYLLPRELPESELRELNDFAMSFAVRNEHDLLETLIDVNRTIHQDFSYVSGSTTLETTPYDVYLQRRGVCQDFANLLICLARLLNVPARYRVGYIHTGADYENTFQSEASHAWVEVYLPKHGWRGFDPTNGVLVGLDHIRVACGRNYRDATPTMGTIFRGGGGETLSITVRVDEVSEAPTEQE